MISLADAWPGDNSTDIRSPESLAPQGWRAPATSLTVMPGEAATPQALQHDAVRQALIALLGRLAESGLSWTSDRTSTITSATRLTAESFLRSLPASKSLPKVAADAEGGLMMVWEGGGDPLLVTVDDLHLHAVIAAATPRAQYLDDIPYWGQIPQSLLDAIPGR